MYPSLDWRRWERETDGRLTGRQYQAIVVLRVDAAGYLWAYDHGTVHVPAPGAFWIGEDFILARRVNHDTGVESVERYRLDRRGRWQIGA